MALNRMVRKGDRIFCPQSPGSPFKASVLIVDHVTDNDIAYCVYEDGRKSHGAPATTCFIAKFSDGSFNQHMEHMS